MNKSLIYLVDDDPVYGGTLQEILKRKEFVNVELFESAEASIEKLDKKPLLVILDFSLKGLNGLDALERILKERPKTKVVMLTSLENKEVEQKCIDAGAKCFFQKDTAGIEQLVEWMRKNVGKSGIFSFLGG